MGIMLFRIRYMGKHCGIRTKNWGWRTPHEDCHWWKSVDFEAVTDICYQQKLNRCLNGLHVAVFTYLYYFLICIWFGDGAIPNNLEGGGVLPALPSGRNPVIHHPLYSSVMLITHLPILYSPAIFSTHPQTSTHQSDSSLIHQSFLYSYVVPLAVLCAHLLLLPVEHDSRHAVFRNRFFSQCVSHYMHTTAVSVYVNREARRWQHHAEWQLTYDAWFISATSSCISRLICTQIMNANLPVTLQWR